MTKNLSEDHPDRRAASGEFWTRQLLRRPSSRQRQAVLFIKIFGDTQLVASGFSKFTFAVSEDMDTMELSAVEAYVSTVSSSGIIQCQVRNVTQTVNMLTTLVQIDANEFTSCTAATAPVISTTNADVSHCDLIAIDVDSGGTNARGLGVMLTFSPAAPA